MSNAHAQRHYWASLTPQERAARGEAMRAGKAEAKAERQRAAAFAKPKRPKKPKGEPTQKYEFRHTHRAGSLADVPAIPTLAAALGAT